MKSRGPAKKHGCFQQIASSDLDRIDEAMARLPDQESGAPISGWDPWTADLAAAEELQASRETWTPWFRSPLAQWATAQNVLRDYRQRIDAGDRSVILRAVEECASRGLVMPIWLARRFIRAHKAFELFEARDLNEAFGVARTRTNLAASRNRLEALKRLPEAIESAFRSDPTAAIDRVLWEAVGKQIGCSGRQAEKLYQEQRKQGLGLTADEIRSKVAQPG